MIMRLKFEESIASTIIILTSYLLWGNPNLPIFNIIFGHFILWLMAYFILTFDLSVFYPTPKKDNNLFLNSKQIDKYEFLSKDERHEIIEMFQHKYPKFKKAYQIHQWIEMWNTIYIVDEEMKNMFLRDFENVIITFDNDWNKSNEVDKYENPT